MTENGKQKMLFSGRDLAALILPLVVELTLKLVVGMIDTVMVSSVGEAAVSGVSLIDSVIQLVIYVFSALAAGGAIVAGQYLGGGKRGEACRAADELIWLNILVSLAITLLLLPSSDWILHQLFGHIDDSVYVQAKGYFSAVVFSIPAIAVFEAGASVFRTMKDSKTTMKISLLMNLLNCAGNALLIYGFSMGAFGAAVSTLIARWVAAILALGLLLNPKRELCLTRKLTHRFDRYLTRQILAMGVPGGIENGLFQLGKIVLISLVTTYGTAAITANAVTQTLASIEVIPGGAVQLAVVTVIARCVGAGDYEQTKFYTRRLLMITYAALAALCAVMLLTLSPVLSLYHLSAETEAMTRVMFYWHTFGAATLWPLAFDLPASLRATGDVRFPMMVSIVSMWIFRIGGAYFLAYILKAGAASVWISMAVMDWGFRAVVYIIRWKGGKWKTKGISAVK